MGRFGIADRFRIPTYNDPGQMRFGTVEIDLERCTECGLCAGSCPARALDISGGKPAMKKATENACAFCGDCAAICPVGAITLRTPFSFTGFYKTIDEGQPSPPRL